MKFCITNGNYHIFLLMIKNHKDQRFQLDNVHQSDFDLVFEVYSSLKEDTIISVLTQELRYSPFMYLCPLYKVIPYTKKIKKGTPAKTAHPIQLAIE